MFEQKRKEDIELIVKAVEPIKLQTPVSSYPHQMWKEDA